MPKSLSLEAVIHERWQACIREYGFPNTWQPVWTPYQGWRIENRDARPGQKRLPLGSAFNKSREFLAALSFAIDIAWARKQALWPDVLNEPGHDSYLEQNAAAMFHVPVANLTKYMIEYTRSCMMQPPARGLGDSELHDREENAQDLGDPH
jgi:hypothetical protein